MEIIDPVQILKLIAALAFVVALMGGLSLLIRKLGLTDNALPKMGQKRLKVLESQALDSRRRLVLVQCDGVQHLVLLGPNSDTIVQTDIKPPEEHDSKTQERSATL